MEKKDHRYGFERGGKIQTFGTVYNCVAADLFGARNFVAK